MNQPLKWHGGKHYLAPKIVALMESAPHVHYVEPYAGGLSVLLAKNPEGVSEVVNDKHCLLMNFWTCLANPNGFAMLFRRAEATPFSQLIWESAQELIQQATERGPVFVAKLPPEARAELAHAFFIFCRQSMSGRMKDFAPLTKARTRRGMNEQCSAWLTAIEGLPEVHARLKRVAMLCDDALKVIDSEDSPDTLFYIDAPYVHDTRAGHTPSDYQHEMTNQEHQLLIDTLVRIQGKAVVSMYHHPIYDALHLKYGWRMVEFDLPNNAAGGGSKRRMIECVWMNYQPTSNTDPSTTSRAM